MAIERIKWKHNGFRQLLKSREVMSDLIARGEKIAAAAGAGYEQAPFTGKNRARVSVATATPAAILENAKNNTLIRSLDRGR